MRAQRRGARHPRAVSLLGMVFGVMAAALVVRGGGAVAADPSMTLISAPTSVDPGSPLEIEVRVPAAAAVPVEATVTAARLADSVTDLGAAVARPPALVVDTVSLGSTAITSSDATLRFIIPTEPSPDEAGRLAFPSAGTYVVTIAAGALGSLSFPVVRRSASASPVPVAIVLEVDAPLSLRPDGTSVISDDVRRNIARLQTLLVSATVPVSVAVRPEVLASLASSSNAADRELVTSLATAFGRQRLLSEPYLHIDPSIAANAGAADDFTAQLRLGEDTLSRLLRRLPDRRVWIATDPLSPAGATLVRNLGASVVVQTAGTARDREVVRRSDPTAQVAPSVLIPTDVNASLAAKLGDPVGAAHLLAVNLLRSSSAASPSTVLLMPDVESTDPEVFGALLRLLAADTAIQAIDIEGVGTGSAQEVDGSAPEVPDFSAARTRRVKLQDLVTGTSAIVPDEDPRPSLWSIRADVLLDTRLGDDDRAAYETGLRADLLAVQDKVLLQVPGAVNLGDRNSSVPVTVENTGDVAVRVVVRLVSGKLRSTPMSDVITVEPGTAAFVRIPISARSNGRFPVRVQLLAPGTKLTVGRSATLNVRVGTLSGLGLVLTFAFVAGLLSWWAQHLRRRWRREATAEIERRRLAGLPLDDFDDFPDLDDDTSASR